MKIFSKNHLSAKDCQIQRIYIYNNLQIILENSDLELIWPINQLIDPINKHQKGFCHGYGEVWSNYLTQENFIDLLAYNKWQELTAIHFFELDSMTLNQEIIRAQREQSCGSNRINKSRIKNASVAYSNRDLIDKIFEKIELQPSSLYIFDLAELGSKCNFLFQYFPGLKRQWHEIRIYLDENYRLHWFDANLGWFRTKSGLVTKDQIQDLKKAILNIFYLLDYKKYQIITLGLKLELEKKNRLT